MENKKDFTKSDLSVFVSYIIPHKKLFAVDMLLSILDAPDAVELHDAHGRITFVKNVLY